MVTDFVKHGRSDLFYQILLAIGFDLDIFLEEVDHSRPDAGLLDASLTQGHTIIEPEEQLPFTESDLFQLFWRRPIAQLDWHFLEVLRELLRQLRQRSLDKLFELRLAHMMRQAIIRLFIFRTCAISH